MRHQGSGVVALRSHVGYAAGRSVQEESGDGKPRFVKWQPHAQPVALAA
jgi:hypothetical protein